MRRSILGIWRGGYFSTCALISAMCSGVEPQQPPTMLRRPSLRPRPQLAGHVVRALVVLAHGVGEAGVGIGDGERLGHRGDLGEVRPHQLRAQRAIEAHGERLQVPDREVERLRRLARQRAPRAVGDGAGDDERQLHARLVERLQGGIPGGLGVQRVEHRLDQQQVHAAVDQPARLLLVGLHQLVEGDAAEARVVHVGRDGRRAVGRPHGAGDPARPVRRLLASPRRQRHAPGARRRGSSRRPAPPCRSRRARCAGR